MVKLSTVATISAGQSAPKNNYFSENGIPFIRAGSLEFLINGKGLDYCEKINETNAKICKLKLYPKNAVLFAKSGMSTNKGRVYKLERDSYVVSHLAVVVTDSCKLLPSYFMYWLKINSPRTLIKDESYPSISLSDIGNLDIDCPSIEEQQRIVNILDKAEEIRTKKKLANEKLDEFLKSTFIDMFGDPVANPKGYNIELIKNISTVITGNTPPRTNEEYYGNYIEWIKSDNINTPYTYLTKAEEYLSELGMQKGRVVPKNSILVTCIAGSINCIGNVALTDRPVAFNQQINAIIPEKKYINSAFLYEQLYIGKKLIQEKSTNSMKGMVSKSKFETIKLILPDLKEQELFEKIFVEVEKQKEKNQKVIEQMDNLFNSLMQQAFNDSL